MELDITLSDSKNKRLKAILKNMHVKKTIHFGAKDGQTYIDHKDKTKRENYIKRHKALNEDWSSVNAGSLSRYILWGDNTDINRNINDYKKKFGLI
jgi:hypothetical protein